MSGEPKTLTLTLEEAMRRLSDERRVLMPGVQSWWIQDEATYEEVNVRPAISEATWPEACSVEWGVPVVARDDAAELRAALEGIVQLLTKPKTDPLRDIARVVGAIGIARAALAASEGQP